MKLAFFSITVSIVASSSWAIHPDCVYGPPPLMAISDSLDTQVDRDFLTDCLTKAGMSEQKGVVDVVVGAQPVVDGLFKKGSIDGVVVGYDSGANSIAVVTQRKFISAHDQEVLEHIRADGLYAQDQRVSELRRIEAGLDPQVAGNYAVNLDGSIESFAFDYQDENFIGALGKNPELPAVSRILAVDCN